MAQELPAKLQIVCWGITQKCNLSCPHCDRGLGDRNGSYDLSTEECFRVIDGILEVGKPAIVLTGGEPLLRDDIFKVASYATDRGLRVVLSTTGPLITPEVAAKIKDANILRVGVSLDFPIADLHDRFRGKSGTFNRTLSGIKVAQQAGLKVEVYSVIAKFTAPYLKDLLNLIIELGVVTWNPVMFVPTGRGKTMKHAQLSPEEYEQTLNWLYEKENELRDRILFGGDSLPQRNRIVRQRGTEQRIKSFSKLHLRGCKAGINGCDILYRGKVVACSMLDIEAGDLRKESFAQIWYNSSLFRKLRDLSNIKGKCGVCEYQTVCGGCRARTYGATGDYFDADPWCTYQPVATVPDTSTCL